LAAIPTFTGDFSSWILESESMLSRKLKLLGLILILFNTGCTKKDEFTIPVSIKFEIAVKQSDEGTDPGYFYFNWVHTLIKRIDFEGIRETGGDIYFSTDPDLNVPFLEFDETPVIISSFELPQGIYSPMRWDIYLKRMQISGLTGTDLPNTGFLVYGGYEYQDGSTIDIFLCIDETELFSFRTYNSELEPSIVLSENRMYNLTLLIDLYNAFLPISRESVERAETSTGTSGEPIIIIAANKNKYLYDNLLYRILRLAEASID